MIVIAVVEFFLVMKIYSEGETEFSHMSFEKCLANLNSNLLQAILQSF